MNKTVSKKKSKTKSGISGVILALMTVVILAVGVLSFVSFEIKGTIHDYNAVINKINLGIDLQGSAYAVLEPQITDENEDDIDSLVEQSIKTMRERLKIKGFSQGSVSRLSDNRIKVSIPVVDNSETTLTALSATGVIEFKVSEDGESLVSGENIKKTQVGYTVNSAQTAYIPVVSIHFDSQGAKDFEKATELALSGSKSIYIYLDGELISSATVSEVLKGGQVSIQNESWTPEAAQNMADTMMSGKLSVDFDRVESALITSFLGAKALTKSLIAGGIALFLVIAAFVLRYKGLGVTAVYSLIIYVLSLFLILTFSGIELTLGGIAAILMGFALVCGLIALIFERIKREYADGRIPEAAIRYGFNRSLKAVIDTLLMLILAAAAVYFTGVSYVSSFALVFMVCAALSGVIALLITRWIIKLFMPLIKNKEKFLGLVREGEQNV